GNQEPGYGGYQQYQGYAGGQVNDAPVKKSGMALAAFIIGIISLLAMITSFSIIPGIVGVIVASIALVRNRKKPKPARRTWMCVLGLISSLFGIVVTLSIFGVMFAFMREPAVQACIERTNSSEELQACIESAIQ